jgi:hypothetical protein
MVLLLKLKFSNHQTNIIDLKFIKINHETLFIIVYFFTCRLLLTVKFFILACVFILKIDMTSNTK